MGLGAHFFGDRRVVLAAFMVAVLLAFVLTRPGTAPAGPAALTVNSTANTSDGLCDDTNCTLREAIDAVNAGPAGTIEFDPAVFPPGSPATIDIEGGDGALPAITADITIDAFGSGVIVDGDTTDNGTAVAQGLKIEANHAGFSFALEGDDNFTLRDIGGHAIEVVGNSFGMDDLTIDAVAINHTTGDAVRVADVKYATHISLSNSTIDAGNAGIRVTVAGPDISSMDYEVTDNDIRANADSSTSGPAVSLNLASALEPQTTVDFTVGDNDRIQARAGIGVNLIVCSSGTPCALDQSDINLSVRGNTEVRGEGDAIRARLNGNPEAPDGSAGSSITMFLNNNGAIDGGTSDSIDISSGLCCGAGNQQIVTVDENGTIGTESGSDAVDIEAGTCCDADGGTAIEVSGNHGPITGGEGDGIALAITCCGTNSIDIEDNEGLISSGDDSSLHIRNCVDDETDPQREEPDCLANTTTLVTITGNQLGGSHEDGIHICCGEFQLGDERSVIANNVVTSNERDGIEINSSHGFTVGPGNVITRNGTTPDHDNNGVEVGIVGSLRLYASFGSTLPSNDITITGNSIYENGGLGIDLVGYDAANTPGAVGEDDLQYAVIGCSSFAEAPINANDCLPYPTLSGVAGDAVQGQTCAGCRVEVFLANDQPPDQPPGPVPDDPTDPPPPPPLQYGEGETFLAAGTADVTSGDFSIPLPCNLKAGLLTATATDADGNTSEFSANLSFSGTSSGGGCTPSTATPTGTPPPTTATLTATPPSATATPPAATATPTTAPVICGDVNGDRSVNSIDAALVLQYTAGLLQTLVEPQGADVNDDGDINSIDAALILQSTAGLPANLRC